MERSDQPLFDINPEGEVVTPLAWDSLGDDLEQRPTAQTDFDPSEALDTTRQTADFRNRNVRLMQAADEVGRKRQAEGAVEQARYGHKVSGRYADSGHMLDIIEQTDDRASEAIRRACASCALADYCGLSQQDLKNRLNDANTRRRFKNRVTADNYSKNDHLCETNLSAIRLNKDQA